MKKILLLTILLFSYFSNIYSLSCPFCRNTFKKFLPGGVKFKRHNSKCPRCGIPDRNRRLWLYLQEELNYIFKKKVILLHVAPEEKFHHFFRRKKNIAYFPIDLYPALPTIIKMDLTKLEYQNNMFDLIICSHVLEHIPDDVAAMREMFRVLKPGGIALVMVPIYWMLEKTVEDFSIQDPKQRYIYFDQSDHVRKYSGDIVDRLKLVNFTVTMLRIKNYDMKKRIEYGLDGYDEFENSEKGRGADIIICQKPLT